MWSLLSNGAMIAFTRDSGGGCCSQPHFPQTASGRSPALHDCKEFAPSEVLSTHAYRVQLGLKLSSGLAFAVHTHTLQGDIQAAVFAAACAADAALHDGPARLLHACAVRAALCCDRVPQLQHGLVPVRLRSMRGGREHNALLLAEARAELCVEPEHDRMDPLRCCSCCLQAGSMWALPVMQRAFRMDHMGPGDDLSTCHMIADEHVRSYTPAVRRGDTPCTAAQSAQQVTAAQGG